MHKSPVCETDNRKFMKTLHVLRYERDIRNNELIVYRAPNVYSIPGDELGGLNPKSPVI